MPMQTKGILQLLQRHGRNLTITYNGSGVYNPLTGIVDGPPAATATVRGYFYNSKKGLAEQTLVEEGNRHLILAPTDTLGRPYQKPTISDHIAGQDKPVSIYEVQEVVSGQKMLFYICRVSR